MPTIKWIFYCFLTSLIFLTAFFVDAEENPYPTPLSNQEDPQSDQLFSKSENSSRPSNSLFATGAYGANFAYYVNIDPYEENNIHLIYKKKKGFIFTNWPEETLDIGGYGEIDGRLFAGQDQPKSTFLIRRARLYAAGELYEMFGYYIMPKWDNQNNFGLAYCWAETIGPAWGRVRVGLFKKPFSLEDLKLDLFRNFNEKSIAILNYAPSKDVGISGFGEIYNGAITYSMGFFNGRPPEELDNNNNKEIVGRMTFRVFSSKSFGKLFLGFSGAAGRYDEDLSGKEFITETFNPFWIWSDETDKPVENHASRIKWGIDIEWLSGPFYFSAEYVYTNWGKIRKGNRRAIFMGSGGYVECSYILTGEDKPRNGPVFPKYNFNPKKNTWGAFEIAARYEIFHASKNMIDLHFAKGANFLHGPLMAVNWYFNSRAALKLNGQYIWFNHPLKINSRKFRQEVDFVCRFQFVF